MDSLRGRHRAEAPRLCLRPRRGGPVEATQAGELPKRPCRSQTSLERAFQFQRSWPWHDYSWPSCGSKRTSSSHGRVAAAIARKLLGNRLPARSLRNSRCRLRHLACKPSEFSAYRCDPTGRILSGAQVAAEERFDECRLAFAAQQETHLRTGARNIDQQNGRFHQGQARCVDKIIRQLAVTQVDGQDIGTLKKFFFADEASMRSGGALGCEGGSSRDQIHLEAFIRSATALPIRPKPKIPKLLPARLNAVTGSQLRRRSALSALTI